VSDSRPDPRSEFVSRVRLILAEQEAGQRSRRPRWTGPRHRRVRRLAQRSRVRSTFGTPTSDLAEAPPSLDQETNMVLSGGGVVRRDGGAPSRVAQKS